MHRAALAMVSLAVLALAGCTIYSEQKSPGVTQTTSAEQVNRIFWQDVEQAKWLQVNALLAPNAVWRVNGQVIPRAQIVPWLQSLGTHGVQVSDVALTPAVNDMNLVYTVQIQADKAVAAQVGAGCAGRPQTLSALAVWQQPQPTGDAKKDKQASNKVYGGYLLTVHDLTATGNAGCS
ncbi:MAG TPA: hypothetical protein VGG80_10660 [Acidobacteriaceae bacterium]|jgi:hypothetical protein